MGRGVGLLACLAGCAGDDSPGLVEGSTGDFEVYEDAVLEIHEPMPGSVHHAGEPVALVAEVLDADDFALDVDFVAWRSDQVEYIVAPQLMAEIDLPIGIHELTTTVRLPNDDRLEASVGGVRVQSPKTGIYAGESVLRLEMELEGQTVRPACTDALVFTVDMHGETFTADAGSCSLELLIMSFDVEYAIEAELQGDAVLGTITYTFAGLLSLPYDFEGTLASGSFDATFAGEIAIPLVGTGMAEGALSATRVTEYVDP